MKPILVTAQSFGFGPVSKLNTIVKYLKKINPSLNFVFVGDGIAYNFITNNKFNYLDIIRFTDFNDSDFSNYSILLSVMEPDFSFKAHVNGIKYLYFDSLFWFWDWENLKDSEFTSEQLEKENSNNEPHFKQYFAHKLAEKSFIQTFGNYEFQDDHRRNLNPEDIGFIIDKSYYSNDIEKRKILFSFSGQISPVNSIDDSIKYINYVLELFKDELNYLSETYEIVITINKLVSSNPNLNKNFNYVSLSSEDFLKTLNESIVIFAPSGLTTLFEALSYEIPIFFLPEQHYNHYENFNELNENLKINKTEQNIIFPNLLLNELLKHDAELTTNEIKEFYNTKNITYEIEAKKIISNFINNNFLENLENLKKSQNSSFKKLQKVDFQTSGINLIYFKIMSLVK